MPYKSKSANRKWRAALKRKGIDIGYAEALAHKDPAAAKALAKSKKRSKKK